MELATVLEKYKDHFQYDPLYRQLLQEQLIDKVFDDEVYFQSVDFITTQSTKQAAQLLHIEGKEQTLINYLNRNDMTHYLKPYRQGRYYRFDWKVLFQFKMILTLTNERDYSPLLIASLVGAKSETYSSEEETSYRQTANGPGDAFTGDNLYEQFALFKEQLSAYESRKHEVYETRQLIAASETDIKLKKQEIMNLSNRLSDLESYVEFFKASRSMLSETKGGLIAKIFGRKATDPAPAYQSKLADFDIKADKIRAIIEENEVLLKQLEATHGELVSKLASNLTTLQTEETHMLQSDEGDTREHTQ